MTGQSGFISVVQFDDDFAGPTEWARMYRALGIQIVPAHMPQGRHNDWKYPKLAGWKSLQNKLVPPEVFDRWYGPGGNEINRQNMGIITGKASGNLFVIDIDDQKTSKGGEWWDAMIAAHRNGLPFETWEQKTGGGGRQILFRAPDDWVVHTAKIPIGVDIRGQGGFAMLPPSLHSSGKHYAWADGRAPWEIPVEDAPLWLLEAIDALIEEWGGNTLRGEHTPRERTESAEEFNPFGKRIDGREDYMTRLIWAAVVNWYRECPIKPSHEDSMQCMRDVFTTYERNVKTRLQAEDNLTGLEAEGRGESLFLEKWNRAMAQWDTKISESAKRSPPGNKQAPPTEEQDNTTSTDPGPFPASELTGTAPERKWLVLDWIAEGVVNSLYGQGGVGKTLLAQQLAYCLATGRPFLGITVTKKKVMCVLCEDDRDEIHRRHDCLKKGLGVGIGNPFGDVMLWPRVGYDNILVTWDKDGHPQISEQFKAVLDAVLEHQSELLILDTLADMYGGNELVRVQVNHFIKTVLGRLILEAKAQGLTLTVLLLAHPSTAGIATKTGLSGSTAWENSVRSRLYLRFPEEGDSDERELVRAKANYAKSGEETTLRLLWREGMFVVAKGDPGGVSSAKNHIRGLVDSRFKSRRGYTGKKGHDRYIYTACVKAAMGFGVSQTNALQAIRELIEDGEIYLSKGSKGARGYRLVDGSEDADDEE